MNHRRAISIFLLYFLVALPQKLFSIEMECDIGVGSIFQPSDSPISVGFRGPGLPFSLNDSDAEKDLLEVIRTWNEVSCASITLAMADDDSIPDIPIYWGDNRTNSCLSSDTEIGSTYISPCINGDTTYASNSILLNSNPRFDWRHSPDPYQDVENDHVVDLGSLLTHEIGHALGLAHSDIPLTSMAPKYLRDGGMRSLAADDKFKLCSLYPKDVNECVNDNPCGEGVCVSQSDLNVCEERRSETGEYCSLDTLTCKTCLITSAQTYSGYCTQICDDGSNPCPAGLSCSEDGFCRLDAGEIVSGGCSTTENKSFIPLMILAFVFAFRRCRTY